MMMQILRIFKKTLETLIDLFSVLNEFHNNHEYLQKSKHLKQLLINKLKVLSTCHDFMPCI